MVIYMGMTITRKILAAKAKKRSVAAGELVECELDLMFGNDITAPVAIDVFRKVGAKTVCDPAKIALIPDHFTPNKDIAAAFLAKKTREFAKEMGIKHYFEVGQMGIEHALLPEKGLISPGDAIIGADSHTCTHGALGAFATGVGSTDLAVAMAVGTAWFKAPEGIGVTVSGKKRPYVTGKDVVLHLIGLLGVDGARYRSLEFSGAIAALTMDDRFTIANMAVEAGAKNCVFPVDSITRAYLNEHGAREGVVYEPDEGAYAREIELNLDDIPLTVAFPHMPDNTKPIGEAERLNIRVDQALIGSCTNGRIGDMRAAADVLRGRKIAPHVRCIIIPATQAVWLQCVKEGLMEIFIDAGAAVSTPTCGPCLGGHTGVLAEGERCVSTTNRNFIGRMGHTGSEVYLASPAVAAASAVKGTLCGPG